MNNLVTIELEISKDNEENFTSIEVEALKFEINRTLESLGYHAGGNIYKKEKL